MKINILYVENPLKWIYLIIFDLNNTKIFQVIKSVDKLNKVNYNDANII